MILRLISTSLLAAGVVTLALLTGAAAQPQPTLTITPASGPCDATVEVSGSGFPAGSKVALDLGGPHSGVSMGRLADAAVGPSGEFTAGVTFGKLGCEAAALDSRLDGPGEPRDLVIFAGYDPARASVITRATYGYTSTTAQVPGPATLPATGAGGEAGGVRAAPAPVIVVGVLGALLLAAASVARWRERRKGGPHAEVG